MTVIVAGESRCSICDGVIQEADLALNCLGFGCFPYSKRWERYSDSAMHGTCFQNWGMRDRFLHWYNEMARTRFDSNGGSEELLPDGRRVIRPSCGIVGDNG